MFRMSSAIANGSLGGAAGSRAVCIFITGHREFPEQEINTSSLFMVAGSWWLMAAEFKLVFSLLLHSRPPLQLSGLPGLSEEAVKLTQWVGRNSDLKGEETEAQE